MMGHSHLALCACLVACGGGGSKIGVDGGPDGGGGGGGDSGPPPAVCIGVDCSGHGTCVEIAGAAACECDGGYTQGAPTECVAAVGPTLAGCPVLPANHVFNTAIDTLPVHPLSDAFMATIGTTRKLHLDLGTTVDPQAADFYGIPYNIAHGASLAWSTVAFLSTDPGLDWNPADESDCATGAAHTFTSPCTAATPQMPIPANPIVEGGIDMASDQQPYGDHHLLVLDADACRLWEAYHVYSPATGTWNIFGLASWDLRSNALRPKDWSSSDAAGFPILPLLLRADEASSGTIKHALRFTIQSSKIRVAYVWPARHLTSNGTTSTNLPPMGQLFRLKASYAIPSNFGTQSKAILQAMKTYGMYIADGGSDMYVSGAADASWADSTFSQVQSVDASNFEAVDLTPMMTRNGFDENSGAAP
jgi:hypothetical protein